MLQEWLDKYYDFFGTDVPQLVNTDVEENKMIDLIKKAIYIDLKPLTLDDLQAAVGDFDIVYESPKQGW